MSFPNRRLLVAGLACLGLALGACSFSESRARGGIKPEQERKKAPDFTLKDSEGRTVKLSDYRGKVVLLNFWATWCGPCKIEIPWFMELEQEYKDRGFAVLGVSMDEEGWGVVKPYITRMRVNYRVLLSDEVVSQLYGGVESLPTTFMIDREGRIARVHVGLIGKGEYQDDIHALMEPSTRVDARRLGTRVPAMLGGAE